MIAVAIDLALLFGVEVLVARLFGRSLWGESSIAHASLARRLAVVAAGPLVVYVLASASFFAFLLLAGEQVTSLDVDPISGSPAERAGVVSGDRVVSVSGRPIEAWEQVPAEVSARGDQPVELVVDRAGRPLSFSIPPESGKIGLRPRVVNRAQPLPKAAARALTLPAEVNATLLRFLLGSVEVEMSGPAGLIRHASSTGTRGTYAYIFGSWISIGLVPAVAVNLGVLGVLWFMRRRHTRPPE